MRTTNFIVAYWKGRLPLWVSFWIVFLLVGILLYFAEARITTPLQGNTSHYLIASVAYLALSYLIILPWQLVGVLRAAEQHFKQHNQTMVLHVVQATALIGVILTISHIIGKAQELLIYHNKWVVANTVIEPHYQLTKHNQTLHISGDLEFGIVKAVTGVLDQHSDISLILLESTGGQIYEGRGLGRLFDDRALDTIVISECSSACITAFIGGRTRQLGLNARLGFHQYTMDPHRRKQLSAFFSPEAEQEKDLELLRSRGVRETFLEKMFLKPSHEMWFPSVQELIGAGVVTSVVEG